MWCDVCVKGRNLCVRVTGGGGRGRAGGGGVGRAGLGSPEKKGQKKQRTLRYPSLNGTRPGPSSWIMARMAVVDPCSVDGRVSR